MRDLENPIQPLYTDEHGTLRFKANAIVQHVMENSTVTFNDFAAGNFSVTDQEQFNQLIGVSHGHFEECEVTRRETADTALVMHERGMTEVEARNIALQESVKELREALTKIGEIADDHREYE